MQFDVFEWPDIADCELTLWGNTQYGAVKIPIYTIPSRNLKGYEAFADWRHGKGIVVIREGLLAHPKQFQNTLWHELTHIIEYMNCIEYLSATHVNQCSMLARTMEVAIADLLRNLSPVDSK